ncbi:hypothetical protein GH714_012041 [Hevea brasiliensis]|uniref:Subtilisin-like protease fibronectin type-III domain-containing protein n=1 Tax=Hevea brasiliensis TaxID=3981 RepID=A0A6A6MYT3_HEVBR|nr:hypothetical protein GH714_012041 [Hevea brasiliensis]
MACPHATEAVAYVKSYHPTWSPAALKSALMTTSFPMNSKINSEAEFAYGVGHINPAKAINPRLIYNAEPIDYIKFLCGQGYNSSLLQMVTGDNSSCSTNGTVWDLNYPSFALSISPSEFISRVYNRIVTNVGSPTSTYKATVTSPHGFKIQVNPSILSFTSLNEKLSFALTVEGKLELEAIMVSASLVWDDRVHQVRSPITVYVVTQ